MVASRRLVVHLLTSKRSDSPPLDQGDDVTGGDTDVFDLARKAVALLLSTLKLFSIGLEPPDLFFCPGLGTGPGTHSIMRANTLITSLAYDTASQVLTSMASQAAALGLWQMKLLATSIWDSFNVQSAVCRIRPTKICASSCEKVSLTALQPEQMT